MGAKQQYLADVALQSPACQLVHYVTPYRCAYVNVGVDTYLCEQLVKLSSVVVDLLIKMNCARHMPKLGTVNVLHGT